MTASMTARTRKRRLRRYITLLILVALGVGAWFAWQRHQKRERPVAIETAAVARRDITESVVATGQLHPVTKVVINPEVAGEIVELPVQEGQSVKQGDLLVRIKADTYEASRDLAEASYNSSIANLNLSEANREKARADFERAQGLYRDQLISEAEFLAAKNASEVAAASLRAAEHGVEQAKARLEQAEEDLAKTTIVAPIDGTVVQLRSEQGERVVGTSLMSGTEIMTVAQLDSMEARVEVGEIDVIMIEVGQKAHLKIDAFRDDTFSGVVTEIANASNTAQMSNTAGAGMANQQVATKFQVKILLNEKEPFRPGMSVTADIETRLKTDVLAVPLQCVTTRAAGPPEKAGKTQPEEDGEFRDSDRGKEKRKRVREIVFVVEDDRVKTAEVTRGISDDDYVEIISGLQEGQEVVSGSYRAIQRELEEGALIERSSEVPTSFESQTP